MVIRLQRPCLSWFDRINWQLLIAVVVMAVASLAGATAKTQDSIAYRTGARGMVPCNDGSFVGGYINCPAYTEESSGDLCATPIVTRSWDGGRTWQAENVNAPDYSVAAIVRIADGKLVTAHHRFINQFMSSSDCGQNWFPVFDTTMAQRRDYMTQMSLYLQRDHRGILYWKGDGFLCMSFDNGTTYATLESAPRVYPVFHVLPTDGLIVIPNVVGNWPGEIIMSFDHGRTWKRTMIGHEDHLGDKDSTLVIPGTLVVNDIFTITASSTYGFGKDSIVNRNLYWDQKSKSWRQGPYLGGCYLHEAVIDSSGHVFAASVAGIYRYHEGSDRCKYIARQLGQNDTAPAGDDSTIYYRAGLYGVYYDLDGGVHPHGTEAILPSTRMRPVSRLDRLYKCNSVEYVFGGQDIVGVELDEINTSNARMEVKTSMNRRLAFVDVYALDSTLPMRYSINVTDKIVGTQAFQDSVVKGASIPTITIRRLGKNLILDSQWPDGPLLWMKDDKLWTHTGTNKVHNDTSIVNPEAGRYRLVGKSNCGCDVYSHELVIQPTSVADEPPGRSCDNVRFEADCGVVYVRRLSQSNTDLNIEFYNVLGQLLFNAQLKAGTTETTVDVGAFHGPLYASMIQDGGLLLFHTLLIK